MTCEAGGHVDEDAIACDLYYADLDGSWNADGDGIFGEIDDDVDLYPDVFVGRASATLTSHVEAFVSKILSYERDPEPGYHLDMLMAGEVLWTDPFTDSNRPEPDRPRIRAAEVRPYHEALRDPGERDRRE